MAKERDKNCHREATQIAGERKAGRRKGRRGRWAKVVAFCRRDSSLAGTGSNAGFRSGKEETKPNAVTLTIERTGANSVDPDIRGPCAQNTGDVVARRVDVSSTRD